jgi:hypothetical protein
MIAEQKIRTQRILGKLIQDGQHRGEIASKDTGRGDAIKCNQQEHFKTLSDVGITRKESTCTTIFTSLITLTCKNTMQDLNKQAQEDIKKYHQAPKTEQEKKFIRLLRGVMGGGEKYDR